ncbi:penicillin-binding protein activator [Marinobacterium weihaiense]|uniref:Penicillin-binding protein activator n=1 Tax=Marinobacterium weihaiense TaxID=2851016 RepID=A0ABS6M877_9GAMM|nr:penicillin-binding protein activator [Marinobacterium weihaiense]MBV0932491.1 penicillin-binding protein activator [Marinobacterium weihaiense]
MAVKASRWAAWAAQAALLILLGWSPVWGQSSAQHQPTLRQPTLRQQMNAADARVDAAQLAMIWSGLEQLPTARLLQLSQADNTYFEQGWFELARQVRLARPAQREAVLQVWRQQWFHHPAVRWLPQLGAGSAAAPVSLPARIERMGVLLPLSGTLATQGQEVLAGMRAALDWDRRQGYAVPELHVYDSTQLATDIKVFIRDRAREDRLDLLVGPMRLPLSQQLDGSLPVAVLALNRTQPGFNGVQLDLASDQELEQLLALMQREGRRRVLLLAPADARWVEPLLARLEQQAAAAALHLLPPLRYRQSPHALDAQLAEYLGVRASEARGQQLQARLGGELERRPRPRQDADAVLLIARPAAGRLVQPMLDFHGLEALPVYALSHIYSGEPDARRDRDLEGVRFCDMPWRLRSRAGQGASSRFFALGMDAGSVYRALSQLQGRQSGYFEGETGNLRLRAGHRLSRELVCVRFRHGVPVRLSER